MLPVAPHPAIRFGTNISVILPKAAGQPKLPAEQVRVNNEFINLIGGLDASAETITDTLSLDAKVKAVNEEIVKIIGQALSESRKDTQEPRFKLDSRWYQDNGFTRFFMTDVTPHNHYQQVDEYGRLRHAVAQIKEKSKEWEIWGVKVPLKNAENILASLSKILFDRSGTYPATLKLDFRSN